ncbi:MAG: molybdopterin-dependent oxidoreductase [Pseudomonadota bacterium]
MKKDTTNLSRRGFLAKGALLGSGVVTGVLNGSRVAADNGGGIIKSSRTDIPYDLADSSNILYSVCLNCNTGCGIKCKVQDGVLAKIDGNPYNPMTMVPHLPMTTTLDDAAQIDGGLCPKGQAGVQIAYDPYRIRKVLKRAGKRGENRWKAIPFDEAITEIVEGGKLFAAVPGEENRHVEGLKTIMAMKNDEIAKAMEHDIKELWEEKDKEKKKALLEAFKTKHQASLDLLIDPEHPDFGAKNNQLILAWGRLKNGRADYIKRLGSAFGTTNMHGHTTVCQGSLYFTCKAISEQYIGGKFSGGKKFYWQADTENSRYILFVGANLFEANYGPTNRTVRLTRNLATGYTKIAVADPRFSKLASKAEVWLPIKPGEDSALAMAMIQWMIANERYDKVFLANANKAAARQTLESSWTNATWLVEIKDGKAGKFLRAADIGIATEEVRTLPDPKDKTKTVEYKEKFMVVMVGGKPTPVDPNDDATAVMGDLFVDTRITSAEGAQIVVKSGLQLLKDSAGKKSFSEWCQVAGLEEKAVTRVVEELTSYGKMAVVDIHRGPAQHTNGFYNVLSWMSINMLLGNYDWKGGMCAASTFKYDGTGGGPFNLGKVKGKVTGFGVSSIRHDVDYEKTTLFSGYPAKRNWYPLASDIYEEIVPSIGDAYPYPIKAMFLYMGTPAYALPAGHTNIEVLADVSKLPLFFTSDILIGTTSLYSDYIFPDLTYLERWEFQGSHPSVPVKMEPIRQPVVAPVPETVTVYGEKMPISLESLLMAINEKLGLTAFGKDALGEGLDIKRPEDFYLRAVANLAFGEKPGKEVPDADARELEIFSKSRRHLPETVFSEAKWKSIVGEDKWAKVVYLLNRGGRFDTHAKGYDGHKLANRYGALLNLYQEKTAGKKYAGTGKSYPGIATYLPITLFDGKSVEELSKGYDLSLITNRTITHTKSRTVAAYWLHPMMPENGIVINAADAKKLHLSDGDRVKVVSATNTEGVWDFKNGRKREMIGRVMVTQAIRTGVVSFALGFGHWATGASDTIIDGETIKGDPRRAAGIHANAVMWTDPSLRNNTCLIDPVGGSVSFYDTKVNLIKV